VLPFYACDTGFLPAGFVSIVAIYTVFSIIAMALPDPSIQRHSGSSS
jgi:hypothetical protein